MEQVLNDSQSYLYALMSTQFYGIYHHEHCDKSHFYLLSSSFFPYIFNTITTKRWQVANKETLLQHSWAFRPSWLAQSLQPFWLTQHYQDYDDNHDDRAGFLLAIQCASLYSVAFCGQPY